MFSGVLASRVSEVQEWMFSAGSLRTSPVSSEFVPEVFEIRSLASTDQRFWHRTVEAEMP